jgi:hypothetical protein
MRRARIDGLATSTMTWHGGEASNDLDCTMVNVRPSTPVYVPKKPCKRCSTSLRYVIGRNCVHCFRHHARDYYAARPQEAEAARARRNEARRIARAGTPHFRLIGYPRKLKVKSGEVMDTIATRAAATSSLGIVGTMGVVESADSMTFGGMNMDLKSAYLLALLKRDAVIWKAHYQKSVATFDDDDVLSAGEVSRTDRAYAEKHASPKPTPRPRIPFSERLPFGRDIAQAQASANTSGRSHVRAATIFFIPRRGCVSNVSRLQIG